MMFVVKKYVTLLFVYDEGEEEERDDEMRYACAFIRKVVLSCQDTQQVQVILRPCVVAAARVYQAHGFTMYVWCRAQS